MSSRAGWLGSLIVATVIGYAAHGAAMDTRAAGRCVALGALNEGYARKAEAVLATATATGHRAVVEQRVREEFAYLQKIKSDKTAQEAWVLAAIGACRSF
jgi:hypothetical protein